MLYNQKLLSGKSPIFSLLLMSVLFFSLFAGIFALNKKYSFDKRTRASQVQATDGITWTFNTKDEEGWKGLHLKLFNSSGGKLQFRPSEDELKKKEKDREFSLYKGNINLLLEPTDKYIAIQAKIDSAKKTKDKKYKLKVTTNTSLNNGDEDNLKTHLEIPANESLRKVYEVPLYSDNGLRHRLHKLTVNSVKIEFEGLEKNDEIAIDFIKVYYNGYLNIPKE